MLKSGKIRKKIKTDTKIFLFHQMAATALLVAAAVALFSGVEWQRCVCARTALQTMKPKCQNFNFISGSAARIECTQTQLY